VAAAKESSMVTHEGSDVWGLEMEQPNGDQEQSRKAPVVGLKHLLTALLSL